MSCQSAAGSEEYSRTEAGTLQCKMCESYVDKYRTDQSWEPRFDFDFTMSTVYFCLL
jgi:hypothetical protein